MHSPSLHVDSPVLRLEACQAAIAKGVPLRSDASYTREHDERQGLCERVPQEAVLLLQRGGAMESIRRGTGADERGKMRKARQRASAQPLNLPCSEEWSARLGRGMQCVGAGWDESHSHVSIHQQLLQQQRCKTVHRRTQRVSIDSLYTGTRRAAMSLLLASHSIPCALMSVSIACPPDLCW